MGVGDDRTAGTEGLPCVEVLTEFEVDFDGGGGGIDAEACLPNAVPGTQGLGMAGFSGRGIAVEGKSDEVGQTVAGSVVLRSPEAVFAGQGEVCRREVAGEPLTVGIE